MDNPYHILPLFAAYAEIHYKLFGFSLISNKLQEAAKSFFGDIHTHSNYSWDQI